MSGVRVDSGYLKKFFLHHLFFNNHHHLMYPSAQSIVLVPRTSRRTRRRRREATSLSTPTPGDEFDPTVPLVTGVFPSVWFQVSPCLLVSVLSLNFMEIQVGDYVWWWDTGVAIYSVIMAFSRIYDVCIIIGFFDSFFC